MRIISNHSAVHLSWDDSDDWLNAFMDIYVETDDGDSVKSPFKTVDDAETFMIVIMKLLNCILECKYENSRE